MDIKEIQNLIKFVQKSGVEEVKIERENFKNLSDTIAQTVCSPLSFTEELQQPSLKKPVNGSSEQVLSTFPKIFS